MFFPITITFMGFPGGSVVKNPPANAGDVGCIPVLGRSCGEENGNPPHWNAKVESQETPGVTGKFGLGIQNEAGQRLIEFCQEHVLVIRKTVL